MNAMAVISNIANAIPAIAAERRPRQNRDFSTGPLVVIARARLEQDRQIGQPGRRKRQGGQGGSEK